MNKEEKEKFRWKASLEIYLRKDIKASEAVDKAIDLINFLETTDTYYKAHEVNDLHPNESLYSSTCEHEWTPLGDCHKCGALQ